MSGQIRWPRDEFGIAHPDDSILLASIRKQLLGKHGPDIDQHIAHCEKCQKRCDELRQPGKILEETLQGNALPLLQEDVAWAWLQSPAAAQVVYQRRQHERLQEDLVLGRALLIRLQLVLRALLAEIVTAFIPYVRKVKPALQRRGILRLGIIPLSGSLAVVFLILALTAIVVYAAVTGHNLFQPSRLPGGVATAKPQPTVVVPSHPTPTPGVVSQSGVTVTPGESIPTIFVCSDKKPHHSSSGICGKNFKPNSKVMLIVQLGDGSSRMLHSVPIDASGDIQNFWSISSCKDVPITVLAPNMTHLYVDLGVPQNFLNGKCSSNMLQKAGPNHH